MLRVGCGGLSALHFPDPTGGTDARRGQDRRSAAQLGDECRYVDGVDTDIDTECRLSSYYYDKCWVADP